MMNKEILRETFEYMYNTRMERGNAKGINAEYEQGEIKGIVTMAFMIGIINQEEFEKYFNELFEKYSIVNKLEFTTFKKAE